MEKIGALREEWSEYNAWNEKYGSGDEDDATEEQTEEAAEAAEGDSDKRIYTTEELVRLVRTKSERSMFRGKPDVWVVDHFSMIRDGTINFAEAEEIVEQWEADGKPMPNNQRAILEASAREMREKAEREEEAKAQAESEVPSRNANKVSAEEEEPRRQPPVPAEPVAEPAVVRPQPPVPAAAEEEEGERLRTKQPVTEPRPASKGDSNGQPKKMSEKQKIQWRLGSKKYTEPSAEDDLQR